MKFLVVLAILTIAVTLVSGQGSSSGCQEHAARERRQNNPLNLIPECNTDGTYQGIQCHPPSTNGRRFCQCWAPDGAIITSPSQRTTACECHRQRYAAMGTNGTPRIGAFVPQCEENGTFKRMQCHGSIGMCWCADTETGVATTEKTRRQLNCN